MHRWRSALAGAAFLAVVAGAGAAVSVLDGGRTAARPPSSVGAAAWQDFVGGSRTSVALGQRVIVLLKAPSLADRVRAAGGIASDREERSWTAAALASQQQFLAEMAEQGVIARPGLRFTKVVNGFSAIADPSAVALLERSGLVAGVYPVRAAYPAALSISEGSMASPLPADLAAFSGRGITVALLDTAVGPATPYLHDRVLPGADVVSGGAAARFDRRPGGSRLETHGTVMAGIVVGRGPSGRPAGVATAATLLPIRVAGWQRDASGRWSLHARTDQIIAGLERAVDPDRDGDTHDAARIALIPLVEPFAAFSDGPLGRAVEGATVLDSLVVAPAGNDGPGGPVFGSIGGPGGSPDALTVGAVDLRPSIDRVPVLIRTGLRVLLRGTLEMVTAAAPTPGTVQVVAVEDVDDLFDAKGTSRVAGRAVLLPSGAGLRRGAMKAASAGAALVVAAREPLPAGAVGLDQGPAIPVLSANPVLGATVREELAAGRTVLLSTGDADDVASPTSGRPASFSSWGLAFGGHLKPELASPGVGVLSAIPGFDSKGRSRFVTVSGASAAAAVAAGMAARLAQARPGLDADGLRSALIGTARPVGRGSPLAQGMGMMAAARAASAEIVVTPASVSFGRADGDGWHGRRELIVRNMSTRNLTVYFAVRGAGSDVVLELSRPRVSVPAGGSVRIAASARLLGRSGEPAATGVIRIAPRDGTALDVPWTLVLDDPPKDLIGDVQLSAPAFSPSDLTPAVLAFRAGTVEDEDRLDMIEPVRRLDVVLQEAGGRSLGLLARLRDLLPGHYAFGITGRGPNGKSLRPGEYRLRLVAWPAAGGAPVVRRVPFELE